MYSVWPYVMLVWDFDFEVLEMDEKKNVCVYFDKYCSFDWMDLSGSKNWANIYSLSNYPFKWINLPKKLKQFSDKTSNSIQNKTKEQKKKKLGKRSLL